MPLVLFIVAFLLAVAAFAEAGTNQTAAGALVVLALIAYVAAVEQATSPRRRARKRAGKRGGFIR